jgi:hypothetical protein
MYVLLLVALAFAVLCDVYDVTETEKGIKAGLGVEANTFWVGTDKPSATALYLRDGAIIALSALIPILALIFHTTPLFLAGLGGPIVAGILHLKGGRQWAALLAGKKPTASEEIAPGSN